MLKKYIFKCVFYTHHGGRGEGLKKNILDPYYVHDCIFTAVSGSALSNEKFFLIFAGFTSK
jgi:hypothetical protein